MKPATTAPLAADAPETSLNPSLRWTLVGLSLTMLMPSLDTSIANAGLPALAQAFHAPFQAVQWIILAYLLAITTLIVSVGRLGDLVGRRELLLAGIALFTVASLFCGAAPTLGMLIASRALQGLGAAIMMALTIAVVGEAVPRERVGRAMGLLGTMSAIGTTLGPSLGGLLTDAFGWRTIFLINVPLGLVNFVLVYGHLPSTGVNPPGLRAAFDKLGTLLLALTLGSYALAMTLGRGHFGALNLALLLTTLLGGGLFLLVEARTPAPLLRLAMFRNRLLSGSLAMSALVATVMMSTLVVGPFFLTRALHLPPAQVGIALSVGPLIAAAAGVPAGRMVDRFGAPRMSLLALGGMALGAFLLAGRPGIPGLAGYLMPLGLITANYALFQTANNTGILNASPSDQRGVISGMISLSRNLGLITGASALGAVFARATSAADILAAPPEAVARGMHTTYGVAGALLLLALLIAMASRRPAGSDQ